MARPCKRLHYTSPLLPLLTPARAVQHAADALPLHPDGPRFDPASGQVLAYRVEDGEALVAFTQHALYPVNQDAVLVVRVRLDTGETAVVRPASAA